MRSGIPFNAMPKFEIPITIHLPLPQVIAYQSSDAADPSVNNQPGDALCLVIPSSSSEKDTRRLPAWRNLIAISGGRFSYYTINNPFSLDIFHADSLLMVRKIIAVGSICDAYAIR